MITFSGIGYKSPLVSISIGPLVIGDRSIAMEPLSGMAEKGKFAIKIYFINIIEFFGRILKDYFHLTLVLIRLYKKN